jgi:hypothetical protein
MIYLIVKEGIDYWNFLGFLVCKGFIGRLFFFGKFR